MFMLVARGRSGCSSAFKDARQTCDCLPRSFAQCSGFRLRAPISFTPAGRLKLARDDNAKHTPSAQACLLCEIT